MVLGKGGNEETVFDATVVVVIEKSVLLICSVGGILSGLGMQNLENGVEEGVGGELSLALAHSQVDPLKEHWFSHSI